MVLLTASHKCGFSRAACQILDLQGVKRITAINVLEDEDIRTGVKSYTYKLANTFPPPPLIHLPAYPLFSCPRSWPTIPQVFIKGNFIGGTDILKDMHLNGQLGSLLQHEKLVHSEGDSGEGSEGADGERGGTAK